MQLFFGVQGQVVVDDSQEGREVDERECSHFEWRKFSFQVYERLTIDL